MYLVPRVVSKPSWKCVNRPGCINIQPFCVSVTEQLYLKFQSEFFVAQHRKRLTNVFLTSKIYILHLRSLHLRCSEQYLLYMSMSRGEVLTLVVRWVCNEQQSSLRSLEAAKQSWETFLFHSMSVKITHGRSTYIVVISHEYRLL